MKKLWIIFAVILTALLASCAGLSGEGEDETVTEIEGPYFDAGASGAEIRLAVLPPQGNRLRERDMFLPDMIQGSLIEDFRKFSAMTLINRSELEMLMEEQEVFSGAHYSQDDLDFVSIGNLTSAQYLLSGNLNAVTSREFSLRLTITNASSGEIKAQFSRTDLTAQSLKQGVLKDAAKDLLEQMGVVLTAAGVQLLELQAQTSAAAQEKLAKSRVADNDVERLINAYSARDLNASLTEAEEQLAEATEAMTADNLGAAIQTDVQRRNSWREKLESYELFYYDYHPFEIWYTPEPQQRGDPDYDAGIVELQFMIGLQTSRDFSTMQKVLRVLSDDLDDTDSRKKWGFNDWPSAKITHDLFKRYKFIVTVGLFDEDGREIRRVKVDMYSQLYQRSDSVYWDATQKMLVRMPNVPIEDLTAHIEMRIISIDNGEKIVNADDAIADGYWYINPVALNRFPGGRLPTIPERERLIPWIGTGAVAHNAAAAEEEEQPEAPKPKSPLRGGRFGLSFSGLTGVNTLMNDAPGNYPAKSWLAATVEIGGGGVNFEGIVHWPLDQNVYNTPGFQSQNSVYSLGMGLGYTFVTRFLLTTLGVGFSYTGLPEGEKLYVPYGQIKFDILPWQRGLGLRLGFMAEAASMEWGDGGDAYRRYFTDPLNPNSTGNFRINGKVMAGLVLWL